MSNKLIKLVLVANGLGDMFLMTSQGLKHLSKVYAILDESPVKEVIIKQLAWGIALHGAIRLFAGTMIEDENTRNRLAQLSYLFEMLQFAHLKQSTGLELSKVAPMILAPLGGIVILQRAMK